MPHEIMRAGYSCAPLLADGNFKNEISISLKNVSEEKVFDRIFTLSLEDMGISPSELKSDMSDIRFVQGDKYLPHYFDGKSFNIRVFEMSAKGHEEIKVLYGNDTASDVSDGHETFEIQYGTKHARRNNERGWFNSVATMPNGDLLRIVDLTDPEGKVRLATYRSKNGGLTWSDAEFIPGDYTIVECGGFIIDEKNCKVFYFAYDLKVKDTTPDTKYCKYYIFESDDNGYTWSSPVSPVGNGIPAPAWAISYSDGITLSCEDGEGPNVDYVFTTGAMRNTATESFCTTAIYSRDGGKSWIFSDSRVEYKCGANDFHEGGLSEETVIEKEDGTLIFYARCQIKEVPHFAKSYSTDHGVTWSQITPDTLSNIYTSNTQPIIAKLNKVPVFLWGGSNSMGGTTYLRYPLNLAYSEDDGETFKGIIDASFQSVIETFSRPEGRGLHTNPDLTFCRYRDTDMAYIVSTRHQMYIQDVESYLYKTKGAFDSFESGISAEGWKSTSGNPLTTTTMGATDGDLAMLIENDVTAVRSLHYMEAGSVSFDLYVDELGGGFAVELQSAFNDTRDATSPIELYVDCGGYLSAGIDRKIKLNLGQSSVSVTFDGNAKTARLTVNGEAMDIPYLKNDNYIGYAVIFSEKKTKIAIDRFIAIRTA